MSRVKYKVGSHSAYNIHYHLVWCPKRRKAVLTDGVDVRLKEILFETAKSIGVTIEQMEVMPDHVHLFVTAPPTLSPHQIVKSFKGASGRVLRKEFSRLLTLPCMWSSSYFCGSVGWVSESVVRQYIANQKSV